MTEKRSANSIILNGQEIKRRRKAIGETQQSFVSQGGITLRTLQRAEGSEAIGAHFLDVIATRLEVPPEELRKKADVKTADVIYLGPVKGRVLIEWLQRRPNDIDYSFHIDPDVATSELIARVIELCNAWNKRGSPRSKWKAEELIRVIGSANEHLAQLAAHGIGLFASSHAFWYPAKVQLANDKCGWMPGIKSLMFIAFAPEAASFVQRPRPWQASSRQAAIERCAAQNIEAGIRPEDLGHVHPDFRSFYSKCWEAVQSSKTAQPKVIALRSLK